MATHCGLLLLGQKLTLDGMFAKPNPLFGTVLCKQLDLDVHEVYVAEQLDSGLLAGVAQTGVHGELGSCSAGLMPSRPTARMEALPHTCGSPAHVSASGLTGETSAPVPVL